MRIEALATPALLIDRAKLETNCRRMREHASAAGVALRPHGKTAKAWQVVRRMHGGGFGPVTVSTLLEAEYFASHGFTDVLYAVGMVPAKVERAAALVRRGVKLSVILDSPAAAQALRAAYQRETVRIPTLIEIDTDGQRAGLTPQADDLCATAAALGDCFAGVLTHAGASYQSKNASELVGWARRERAGILLAAERLRQAGFDVPIVSIGSTPTALFGDSFQGISEVRAGVYAFFDLVMAELGVCSLDDIALSVLTSVIGHRKDKGWLLVDAGWMALSRDRGIGEQRQDPGYGLVVDLQGGRIGDLVVVATNQEHGVVASRTGAALDFERFPSGSLLRILPNHACATAAQHPRYHVLGAGGQVEDLWERLHGW